MNDNLFNNELTNYRDNFDFFVNLYLNNKLPQAFILSGENGIGKLNFIYHMLNFIFSVNDEYKYDLKNYKILIQICSLFLQVKIKKTLKLLKSKKCKIT